MAPPDGEDVLRVLMAWRIWVLGGLLGALIGGAAYVIAPPPYRARATVNVDFHLEQAWPQNTDREQFYYLERETRKLIEIAMSDSTLGAVAANVGGVTPEELRSGVLQLSQPGNGGWHFYADDRDPDTASRLAGAWALAFADQVQREVSVGPTGGLESFISVSLVQAESIVPERSQSPGVQILVGAGIGLALAGLMGLLVRFR